MGRLKKRADLTVVTGPDWPGVSYFCSTRMGGVSKGPWSSLNMGLHVGDDPAHVAQNRQRVLPPLSPVFWLNQVHGTYVFDADVCPSDHAVGRGNSSPAHEPVQADALVSASSGHVLAIMTADCLPVVLGSTDGKVVGVAHAGWRGLASGVLENTLAALQEKHPGPAPQWRAWIGPGIGPSHFEVGNDVHQAFAGIDTETSRFFQPAGPQGKWLADLSGVAHHRLVNRGVAQVDASAFCTYRDAELFYSYRRDGRTGRMVTLVWIDPET